MSTNSYLLLYVYCGLFSFSICHIILTFMDRLNKSLFDQIACQGHIQNTYSARFNWEGRRKQSPVLLSLPGPPSFHTMRRRCLDKVSSLAQPQMWIFSWPSPEARRGRPRPWCGTPHAAGAVCPFPGHENTGGGSGSHIRKYGSSFGFGSRYMVSMETRMTSPSFSGEGMAFTAIQSLLLKFFLSKKPVVQRE